MYMWRTLAEDKWKSAQSSWGSTYLMKYYLYTILLPLSSCFCCSAGQQAGTAAEGDPGRRARNRPWGAQGRAQDARLRHVHQHQP